jgi:hypothetical protein
MNYLKEALKSKLVLITALVIVIGASTFAIFNFTQNQSGQNQSGQHQGDENLFTGFSKLVLSSAHAKDNFSFTPKKMDSLGVDTNSTYVLTSQEELDTNSIKDALKIEPAGDYKIEKISNTQWEIIPKEEITPNTLLKVSIAASYIAEDGQKQEHDYSWAYQMKDNFRIINNIPRDTGTSVPFNTGIEVTFTHDNYKDFDKYFEISPDVPGAFEKHGRTAVFVPTYPLKEGSLYTVTIKAGLPLDGSDEKLAENYIFTFETRTTSSQYNSTSWLSISNPFIQSSTKDQPGFQVYAKNIPNNKVSTRVYRFEGWQKYFDSVKERDQYPWWSGSKDRFIQDTSAMPEVLTVELDILTEKNVSYIQLPDTLDKGYYIIELDGPNENKIQAWLQVSDLATFYTITLTDTIFWVNNPITENPVNNANISIIDTNYSYTTDNKGIAKFQIPDEINTRATDKKRNKRDYFLINSGNDNLILPASPISSRYSWSRGNKIDKYWNYLYSDRPLYQTTDKIKYWGMIKDRNNEDIDEEITVSLYKQGYVDYYYRPVMITEQTIQLSDEDTFIGEIDIENLRPDYYTLDIKIGDKVIRTRSITIKPYTKPSYSLSITPDRTNAYADEIVNLKIKAAFFEGTPVPNLDLTMRMPEGNYEFTTNEKGEADLTYTKAYTPCARDYTCWPSRVYLSIYPTNSELTQITAGARINFYGPNIYATQKVEYPEAGKAQINFNTKFIDFDALTNDNWWSRNKGEEPAPNKKIEGELTKITYNKEETGTRYDFINKRSYKTYRYNRVETVEDTISIVTDASGNYTYTKQIEPKTSYILKYKVYDDSGRYDTSRVYLYYYDGHHILNYSSSDYKYYRLILDEEKNFSIGEKVDVAFMENDIQMPDSSNSYLYLQYQNGLQQHNISGVGKYSFDFQNNDVPNVALQGIHFNGSTYIKTTTKNIMFEKEDRKLKVSVGYDKELYKPGEEVKLDFFVRDINDRPVQAEISVNLVDEAFYAVADETVDPLSVIYRTVNTGIVNSFVTHTPPVAMDSFAGAEKGGCFLPGTQIEMSDGSQKSIEEIMVGDEISTFSDSITKERVSGQVTKVLEHTVNEYTVINDRLYVTPIHMVYANGRFVDVASLKVGDRLMDSNGDYVFVEKIEQRHELTKVYNFEVDPQHTYFASGLYVHNEKGGGPREFFVDTALFDTVKTNRQGKAELKMTLPDNITSWRVTAQALSKNIEIGSTTEKIPVSLPVFTEVTIGNEYLVDDQPIARMRAFGTALSGTDKTTFSISAPSLDSEESKKQTVNAFESSYFPLPTLVAGKHDITYSLATDKGDDAVLLPVNIIQSRVSAQVAKSEILTTDTKVIPDGELPIAVILLDQGQNKLYRPLQSLSWTNGSRVDQILPKKQARGVLTKYYDKKYFTNDFNAFDYQTTKGSITLLPYSSDDLELSARVAFTGKEEFDQESLAQYFFRILEDKTSSPEYISYALAGLAALEKPVLPRISSWLNNGEHSVKEKLYLAQAINNLGAKEWSRGIYLDIMNEYAEIKTPEISIRVSENYDEIFHATALSAVLATSLDEPEAEGLWLFLINNQHLSGKYANSENLFTLEKINYIKKTIGNLKPSPAKVKYELFGREKNIDITGGSHHSFQISPQQVDELKFLEITGDVGITTSYTKPIEVANIDVDDTISVRREYYVDGVRTNTFEEGDTIEIRLYTNIRELALAGRYQLTDILPSGLEADTKYQRWGAYRDCDYRYPFNAAGQVVKFNIGKYWRNYSCKSDYFKYFARIKNKGTYVAEPAIIQSFVNPEFINYSKKETVTIK